MRVSSRVRQRRTDQVTWNFGNWLRRRWLLGILAAIVMLLLVLDGLVIVLHVKLDLIIHRL